MKSAMSKKQTNQKQQKKPKAKSSVKVAPVAIYSQTLGRRPSFSNKGSADGRIVVRHREYFADLNGSIAFACTSFPINPGMALLFPWLNRMAANYESYHFNRLEFHYKTAASTTSVGSVIMSVDYDPADAAPSTLQQVYQNWGSTDCQVWESDKVFRCDRADMDKMKQRFIRSVPLAANLDIKTYDVGNFNICTVGEVDTSVIGRLWVDYEVELITPQGKDNVLAYYSHMYSGGGGISRTIPFGLAPVLLGNPPNGTAPNNLGIPFLIAGEYLLSVTMTGTAVAANPITGFVATNLSTALASTIGTAGTSGAWIYKINVLDVSFPNRYFLLDFTPACATLTSCNIYITEYDYSTA